MCRKPILIIILLNNNYPLLLIQRLVFSWKGWKKYKQENIFVFDWNSPCLYHVIFKITLFQIVKEILSLHHWWPVKSQISNVQIVHWWNINVTSNTLENLNYLWISNSESHCKYILNCNCTSITQNLLVESWSNMLNKAMQ